MLKQGHKGQDLQPRSALTPPRSPAPIKATRPDFPVWAGHFFLASAGRIFRVLVPRKGKMEAPGSRFVPGRRGASAQFKVNSLTGPWRIAIRAMDGTSMSQFRSMAVLEQASWKWQELAERRRAHLVELFHSGRWKRYFTEEQFLHRLRDAIRASERWAEIAPVRTDSAQHMQSDARSRQRTAA